MVKFHESFDDETSTMEKCSKIIKAFLECESGTKAMVICDKIDDVSKLHELFHADNVVITGPMQSAEKKIAINSFISDPNIRVIIGTCPLNKGLDVVAVQLVITFNYFPDVHSWFQCLGRIRGDGASWSLFDRSNKLYKHVQCFTEVFSMFYGLEAVGHAGCCNYSRTCSIQSKNLFSNLKHFLEGEKRSIFESNYANENSTSKRPNSILKIKLNRNSQTVVSSHRIPNVPFV